jgi:hypothetical protein
MEFSVEASNSNRSSISRVVAKINLHAECDSHVAISEQSADAGVVLGC